MTDPNNTFNENLELSKSLTASVWERLENLGMAKGGPGSGPHASGGGNDGGTHQAWVNGGAKGNSPATQSIKDSVARNPSNDNLKSALANSKAGDQSARSGDHAAARESYQAASDSHMGAEAGSSWTINSAGSENAQTAADYHSGQDNSYPKDWTTKANNTFDENLELAKSLTASVWERLGNFGIAKGGPGSGPHATGGGGGGESGGDSKSYDSAKAKADAASAKATWDGKDTKASLEAAGKAHAEAASAHEDAAKIARANGDNAAADMHSDKASGHWDTSDDYHGSAQGR